VVRELSYPLPATLAKGPCKVSYRPTTRSNPITRILAFKTTGFKSGFNSGLDGNLKNFCSWQYRPASVLEKYLIYSPGAET
jgi:hypothetical protein